MISATTIAVVGHVTPGFGNLGVSVWFVLYGLAVVLGLTVLAVRAQPRTGDATDPAHPPIAPVGSDHAHTGQPVAGVAGGPTEGSTPDTPDGLGRGASSATGSAATAATITADPPPPAALDPSTAPTAGAAGPGWSGAMATAGRTAGLVLYAIVLASALLGDPAGGSNPAPLTVFVVFFVGLCVVSLVVGDVWRFFSPFTTIAAVAERIAPRARRSRTDEQEEDSRDWWVPAMLLFAFEAWWLVVIGGTRPHAVGALLVGLTAVMVVGGLVGGRSWCRRNDPFAVVFAVFASLAPFDWEDGRLRSRRPLHRLATRSSGRRTGAVLAVLAGTVAFDHAASTNWWLKTINGLGDVAFTTANLLAFAWCVGLLTVAWVGAGRLAADRAAGRAEDPGDAVATDLTPSLHPLVAGLFLAYSLPRLLVDVQNVVALWSDPFGRGWDLFGTLGMSLNEQPIAPSVAGWLQVALISVGAMASIAVLYRRIGPTGRASRRVPLTPAPLLAFLVVVTLGGVRLVLGA